MSMKTWAEQEIEIAKTNNDDVYYRMCLDSALKAYKCLVEDGHSGLSISFTKRVLNSLIAGTPLSPIYDTDDVWSMCSRDTDEYDSYQCSRMSSLFKYVYKDGHVEYRDVDMFTCYNVFDEHRISFHSGLASRILQKYVPIRMPYVPTHYDVAIREFLTDKKNGDFDTVAILQYTSKDGKSIPINRYFKCDEGFDIDWVEITYDEYRKREQNMISP